MPYANPRGALSLALLAAAFATAHAACASANNFTHAIKLDPILCQNYLSHVHPYSPVSHGEANVRRHPLYSSFLLVARSLGVSVEWVESVAEVSHIKLGPDETIEGYFDGEQNRLFLDHHLASLATLVHELRHAEHLGTNHPLNGSGVDREIQLAARAGAEFERLVEENGSISPQNKQLLISLESSLIVNASEILAHYHDIMILLRRNDSEEARVSMHYRKLYRRQFLGARHKLESLGISARFPFIERLGRAVDAHYFSENTRAARSTTRPTATIQSSGNQ